MTEDYYYNSDWKCVEERTSGEPCARKQYVYGVRGRNDLIERDNYLYNSSSSSPSCSSAGKERHYALNDAMGSVTAVANTAGAVVERYSYTAFGQSQVMDKDFATRSMSLYDWQTRFHGESRDEESGYYNYGYRYYDPVTGRWPSRDPIGERGGFNLYGFIGNDGLNRIDLLGLSDADSGATTINAPGGGSVFCTGWREEIDFTVFQNRTRKMNVTVKDWFKLTWTVTVTANTEVNPGGVTETWREEKWFNRYLVYEKRWKVNLVQYCQCYNANGEAIGKITKRTKWSSKKWTDWREMSRVLLAKYKTQRYVEQSTVAGSGLAGSKLPVSQGEEWKPWLR